MIVELTRKGETFQMLVDDDFKYDRKIGVDSKGYAYVYIDSKFVNIHRLIMGSPKGKMIDHIDGNRLNNKRENLRVATNKQNQANAKKRPSVRFRFGKFNASIKDSGKNIHVGTFATEEEALQAYKKKHVEIHGDFSPYKEELI